MRQILVLLIILLGSLSFSVSAETYRGPIAKSWWPSTTCPITTNKEILVKYVPNDNFVSDESKRSIKILKSYRKIITTNMQVLIQWLPTTDVSVVCLDETIVIIVDQDTAVEISVPKYIGT
jgi:hypothetical protein